MQTKIKTEGLTVFIILFLSAITHPCLCQLDSVQALNIVSQFSTKQITHEVCAKYFTQNAYVLEENGTPHNGLMEIEKFLIKNRHNAVNIQCLLFMTGRASRNIYYSIYQRQLINGDKFLDLILWELENEKPKFNLIYTTEFIDNENTVEFLEERRALWSELCNKHNAADLIKELYSPHTIYYNHKPLIVGRDKLIDEYAYMNRENYHLKLKPEFIQQAHDQLVFEIGQCEGSYGGKYILVWKKESDNVWQIFLDSNI